MIEKTFVEWLLLTKNENDLSFIMFLQFYGGANHWYFFAQSAVFTPSDFAFPVNGIKAEASPNTEMIVVIDVDLSLLQELHEYGSVQILKDRRHDLYKLELLKKDEQIG